ncbi:MAG: hypothetical protein ACYC2P_13415 [Paludibacteraceae bacterium]
MNKRSSRLYQCVFIIALTQLTMSLNAQQKAHVISTPVFVPVSETANQDKQKRSALSPTKNYFSYSLMYSNYVLIRENDMTNKINQIMSKFSLYENKVCDLLNKDVEFPQGAIGLSIPVWGVIYANLPAVTKNDSVIDKNTASYALALICAKRYDEAAKTALNIINNDKDNYGTCVLLGLLSVRDKSLFTYLEKAFDMNPLKTLLIVEWHCTCLEIKTKKEEWDFIDAYIKLAAKHHAAFKNQKLPFSLALRLVEIIQCKYYKEYGKILPEKANMELPLERLKIILNPILASAPVVSDMTANKTKVLPIITAAPSAPPDAVSKTKDLQPQSESTTPK